MAGFWHLSHHQLHDRNGLPLAAARAYFFAAETLTPLIVYQDYSLALPHPSPVVADAKGIFPPVFLDESDEFYRQRVTDSAGVIVAGSDVIVLPIIGPSGGGGGAEVPVDPNSLFSTGDVMWQDVDGTRAGWVRDNGRTIGSATSGASERANSDAESLFLFLWNAFDNTYCPVSGGRGITAAADWSANKTIALPDKRGFSPAGLVTMGNSSSAALAGVPTILGDSTTAGGKAGAALHTLTQAQLPSASLETTIPAGQGVHDHPSSGTGFIVASGAGGGALGPGATVINGGNTEGATLPAMSGTTALGGSNAQHNNTGLVVFGTFYRKL